MKLFRVVSEHAARTPIARAIAFEAMVRAVRNHQLSLYYVEDGSEQTGLAQTAAQALMVAIAIRDAQEHQEDDAYRLMADGMAMLERCSADGFIWRQWYSLPLDDAVTCALGVMRAAKPAELKAARERVIGVDDGLPRR